LLGTKVEEIIMASDDEEQDLEMTKGDSPIKTPAKSESSSNNEAFE